MNSKFLKYWQDGYRDIIPAAVIFAIALAIPPFQLFEDRAAGMLQSHLLLELFAVVVAVLIAVVSWYDLEKDRNPQSGLLLAGFSAVAVIDLLHALTYEGMPTLITGASTPSSIFFWLAGRTFVVLILLLLAMKYRPNLLRRTWLIIALLITAATFWLGTFGLDLVPTTFVPGMGVTPFKSYYEYGLFGAYILLALVFIYQAPAQTQRQSFALASSCLLMAMGEIVFSHYKAPSDFLNNFGHVFKVASYGFLYQSMFVLAIRRPYEQALQSEARFRALAELSADWLWEQDEQFRFIEIPQVNVKGYTQSKLGLARWDSPHTGLTDAQWQAHREMLERHEPFKNFVYQTMTVDGELRTVSVSGSPIFGSKGEFLGYRGIGTDITDRQAAEKQIEFLAYHDALTGVPNRLLLQARFEQVVAHAKRTGIRAALLFLDLDNFKNINDTLGHDAGDALLQQVAMRLRECVRDTDTISRQGGDEFLIVLSDLVEVDDTAQILEKLVERMQEPFHSDGHEIYTSVSIGVAVFPEDGSSFETLRRKADMAMFRAKEGGRNTYRFFDEAMNEEATEHLVLRNGLRRALERDEFVLHYQPQIDLASGAVIGAEALIRWNHPELGMVSPARFIPVAEESGLIVPIGEWVLREACRQAMVWKCAGRPALTIAVNLSAVQFKRGDMEKSVVHALETSGLDPALLELELTESILIQNVEKVLATVKRLKLLGVKIAIDDFGTDYSSLSYLKRFDIDKLKIDQSFVRDLATDPDDAAIVRAIIQMARSLNLRTIAEGVETEEMLQQLRIFQCDEVQGYLFARPMSAEAMDRFLQFRRNPKLAAHDPANLI